MMTGTLTQID